MKQIMQTRKEKKECLTRALSEVSVEVASQLKEQAKILGVEEDTEKYANRVQSAVTEIGDCNLII